MIPLNLKSIIKNPISIHWILIISVLFSGIVLIAGGYKISQDINRAAIHGSKNLAQSDSTTDLIEHLVKRQLPLRKIVNEQKFHVNTFAYEFDLFVAKEDGVIAPLKNSFLQMVTNYKRLESAWISDLPSNNLELLKAYINTTIGIYEEAAEFDIVGFGEIYRLAEESKNAVAILISIMEKIEGQMDEIVHTSKLKAAQESITVMQNNKSMLSLLEDISEGNRQTLILIFSFVIIFQIVFYYIFKNRVVLFSQMANTVSEEGNLTRRIKLKSSDKFGELATAFNNMLDNLQKTTISRSFLNSIIESIEDAILVISPNGIIRSANASSTKITKIDIQNLVGTSIYDLFSNELSDITEMMSNGKKIINLEKTIAIKNGGTISVLFSASYLIKTVGSDSEENIICVIRDITDRIKIENEKIRAEKVASEQTKYALIGQVAGKMAHDFNNVLGIIMGNVELSLMTCRDTDLKKTLTLIFDQTIRGKNLTKNLVAFAKSHEPEYKFFKINEKIDLVNSLLRKDLSEINLRIEENTEEIDILADPGMIEHALINLIQNSIHATSKTENPKIIFRSYCRENFVCIEIEDNGCGIPAEFLKKIYDPSFTLKGSRDALGVYKSGIKGTGYGMANVKKYVDQHKGEISLESSCGEGTKVTIRLPNINRELSIDEKLEINDKISCFGRYILIVEDEPAISDVQRNILMNEPCKHEVDIASSGEAALKLLDRGDYDAISLDYVLSGKMNGMEVYNQLRKNGDYTPILFVSGNLEFLESIKDLKINDSNIEYLSKPCQNKEYLYSINALLRKLS